MFNVKLFSANSSVIGFLPVGYRYEIADFRACSETGSVQLPAGFQASPDAPENPLLGNNVKSRAILNNPLSESMVERYRLLSLSKRILRGSVRPGHNILGCQRVTMRGISDVAVTRWSDPLASPDVRRGYHFSGVVTCKSVWVCPVCSYGLSGARAQEIRDAIRSVKKAGGDVYMLTLTFRHSRFDDLGDMLERCKSSLAKLWRQRGVRDVMRKGFAGRITATEFTYSDESGWHPHQHILLFGGKGYRVESIQSRLGKYWIRALESSGLSGIADIACNVQSGSAVKDYLTKMSGELALGNTGVKQGRAGHYTPFQLLGMCRVRDDYKRLWREFYGVTRGKRALVWSRGLKRLCGVPERTDEEIADVSEKAGYEILFSIDGRDFRELLTDYDLGFIRGGPPIEDVVTLLDRRGVCYRMMVGKKEN